MLHFDGETVDNLPFLDRYPQVKKKDIISNCLYWFFYLREIRQLRTVSTDAVYKVVDNFWKRLLSAREMVTDSRLLKGWALPWWDIRRDTQADRSSSSSRGSEL